MPVCRKCENQFPNRMVCGGKLRNVSKRAYCLDCSPWGQHNTRRLETPSNDLCRLCHKQGTERNRKLCKGCNIKVRRWRLKITAINYLGGKCQRCGLVYNRNFAIFDFHHRDGQDKDYNISGRWQATGWDEIKSELDKCELLCSSCHRLTHCNPTTEVLDVIYDYAGAWELGDRP